jgi:hypothetical protein
MMFQDAIKIFINFVNHYRGSTEYRTNAPLSSVLEQLEVDFDQIEMRLLGTAREYGSETGMEDHD